MSQYQEGTVSVTNGSQVVQGTNTDFVDNVDIADLFGVDGDNVFYEIASVDSATQITLAANYAGSTTSGVTYAITRDFTPNRGYPLLSPGDLEASAVVSRAMKLLDRDVTNAGGGSGGTVQVSSNDISTDYLKNKLVAGTGVTLTENNDGSDETLTIAASGGGSSGSSFRTDIVQEYNVDNTGATDTTAEMRNAIASGNPLYAPAGTYWVNLTGITSSFNIVGDGRDTVFVADWNNYCFEIDPGFAAGPYTISAVDQVLLNTVDLVTRLTFSTTSEAANFAKNDVARINSDDNMPHGGTECSEVFKVHSVDTTNGYVYCHRVLGLESHYATSIRIYKLDDTVNVYIADLAIGVLNDPYGTSPSSDREDAIDIRNIVRPILRNVDVTGAQRSAIVLSGCYRGDMQFRAYNIANIPSDDSYGYAGVEFGANYGNRWDIYAEECRHAFTTTSTSDATNDDDLQGASVGAVVTGMSLNAHGEAFDTHEESIDLTFESCIVYGPRQAEGAITGKGFQDRGRGTTFRNCSVFNASGGTFDLNGHVVDHGQSHRTTLIGCHQQAGYAEQYDVAIRVAGPQAVAGQGSVHIMNLSSHDSQRVLELEADAPPTFLNGASVSGIQSGGAVARINTGATLYVTSVTADFTDGGGGDVFEMEGTAACHVNTMQIVSDGTHPGEVFRDEDGGSHVYSAQNITAVGGTVALDDGSGTFTTQNNLIS